MKIIWNNALKGNKIITNSHTSSELAVIGSGDVLAGIIASLVGDQKMSIYESSIIKKILTKLQKTDIKNYVFYVIAFYSIKI